ncbi:MFS transporter [Pengzhenrongella sicca]|uniref:MFS transporter n=1 Tax=Pengzhenrongella sicca TaxID=2819238 RepID=A0A8A4Z8A1_9MICO|nr:MFS transporter [Pengzhenrongella sicca]QTE28092.1 MFS transporter [Pengzhenrongella sicca]
MPNRRWSVVIPVAAVLYMLAFLDRSNVAVILPFIDDPGMRLSAADQGLISGIFFLGYLILQVPAAILAHRWSAKNVVLILMIGWGLAATATGLVQSREQFLVARFALGLFQGGIWPAVLVLLVQWFPQRERARANSLWMTCLPLASILMSPLSGILLEHYEWRLVLIIEGLLPLAWAAVWWRLIADSPAGSPWVSPTEAAFISSALHEEEIAKPDTGTLTYAAALRDRRVLRLVAAYFCWISGFYGFTMWLPTVIKNLTGGSAGTVGLVSAIPYVFALAAMLALAAWSDRTGRRNAAVAVPLLLAAAAMVTGQLVDNPVLSVALLCVVAMGLYSPLGSFWAIPAGVLRIEILAFALGLINAIGNLGGFLGPYLVGWLTDRTGSDASAYVALAVVLVVGALLVLGLRAEDRRPTG